MSKWANRLLLVALVSVLVIGLYSLADLGLRQLRYNNCLRQFALLEVCRTYLSEPVRSGVYRITEGLDPWADRTYAATWYECQLCRQQVESWPR